MEILRELERHYADMQDTEFTVEEGQLYMLQTRNAKRPAQAAVRFAVDAVAEGLLDKAQALADDRPRDARRAAAPDLRPAGRVRRARLGRGRLAGRRDRRDRLHRRRRRGRPPPTGATSSSRARSPRPTTSRASTRPRASSPREGGKASHAALVARGMGVPAVTGRQRPGDRRVGRRGARGRDDAARGRPAGHRRHHRRRSRPTTCRSSSPRSATRSTPS